MNLIVDLPSVLQSSILCHWLNDSVEIGLLDSAFCNRQLRPDFLQALSSAYVIPTISTNEEEVLSWLMLRNVKANDLTLVSDVTNEKHFIEVFFGGIGSDATSITFEKKEEDTFSFSYNQNPAMYTIPSSVWPMIHPHCSKLRKLNCKQARVDPSIHSVILAATQLREVNFEGAQCLTADLLQVCCILPHIEKLNIEKTRFLKNMPEDTSFQVSKSVRTLLAADSNLPAVVARSLVEALPNLTELSMLVADNATVLAIAKLTPNLLRCTLTGLTEVVSTATATAICAHWSLLQYLGLFKQHQCACPEDALLVLVQGMPSVQFLRLIKSTMTRDIPAPAFKPASTDGELTSRLADLQTGFMSVATLQRVLAVCPALHTLHLCWPDANIEPHDPELFTALHNTAVSTLLVENCIMHDEDLLTIRNMEHLFLIAACGHFTSSALEGMAVQNANLRAFYLSSSPIIANYSYIRTILKFCPQLGTLVVVSEDCDMNGYSPIHRAFYQMIQEFYPNVHSVRILL